MLGEETRKDARQGEEYMGYKLADIESALDPKVTIPTWMDLVSAYASPNETARRTHPPETFQYADHPRAALDLYRTEGSGGAPALIFFHGGGFKLLSKDDVAFGAPMFNAAGVTYIAPSYPLTPDVRFSELLAYTRQAAKWIYENAQALGIDRERIYVGGASAGGFISAYLLTTDWRDFGLPRSIFKGGMPLNSVFDARPLYLSPGWDYLSMSEDEVEALSPIHHLSNLAAPTFVSWAEDEPPLLAASSRQFVEALRERGLLAGAYVAPGRNHFDMVLDLTDPESALFRTMADMILAG
ncbi:MAG TPA: alpha/beta hydrolase [Phenylobacterium sp.]|uniref:alpha/beta hydrolase n=1 Tax=Phenylobacterium sp. TaxID=1871053 RepID=UPI002B4829FF|nr:alpha/beta hydrolase [Phenylobacterium sp.]HKR89940.1 alpha/beta hydrolase [Phenylobacterium sp.]